MRCILHCVSRRKQGERRIAQRRNDVLLEMKGLAVHLALQVGVERASVF